MRKEIAEWVAETWGKDPLILNVRDYVKNHNPSGDLPYHNTLHMEKVAVLATVFLYNTFSHVGAFEFRVLILAALFHDFDHTGGKETDDVNIQRAIDGWIDYADENKLGDLINPVCQLIRSTQYPAPRVPSSTLEEILHDADWIYAVMTNDPDVILIGLRKEMEIRLGKKISMKEMYEGQIAFMDKAIFYTPAGQDCWMSHDEPFQRALQERVAVLSKT